MIKKGQEKDSRGTGDKRQGIKEKDILNQLDDLVRVVGREGEVLYQNRAMVDFLDQMHGQRILFDFPSPLDNRSLQEGQPVSSEFCLGDHVFFLRDNPVMKEGRLEYVVEVFRNITVESQLSLRFFAAYQQMRESVRFATSIQNKILPDLKDFNSLHFDSFYRPSEELSGDFFDLLPLEGDKLALYISDVVGHGMSASIFTMFIRQAMQNILREQKISRPSQVMQEIRRKFAEISPDDSLYFSMFYGLFDLGEGVFYYANAGHNCPPLLAEGGKVHSLELPGPVVSPVFNDMPCREDSRPLQEGQAFLFYTDGVTETQSPDGRIFGSQPLVRAMGRDAPLQEMVEELSAFRQQELQKDDIALLYVRNGE